MFARRPHFSGKKGKPLRSGSSKIRSDVLTGGSSLPLPAPRKQTDRANAGREEASKATDEKH